MVGPELMHITEVANVTERLQAELLTAKASDDSDIIHASLIEAVEGLLRCTRAIAFELLKVEVEGLDNPSF